MDKIDTYRENAITDLIRNIVNAEIDKRLANHDPDKEYDDFYDKITEIIKNDAFHLLSDDISCQIEDIVGNATVHLSF